MNLKSLDKAGIFDFIAKLGLPRYRADQILLRLYRKHAADFEDITEFSRELRSFLKGVSYISNLRVIDRVKSADNTEKFLFSLEDGESVESVLIPDGDRLTLCISSQVGCAMGCLFCRTGRSGFTRNLQCWEIVEQIIAVHRIIQAEDDIIPFPLKEKRKKGFFSRRITNIVFMGMGEPLANFDEVVDALWRMTELLGISKRKITLSTAGIVPGILRLPKEAPAINLAISLNASTDEVRDRIMPVNRKYPLHRLINACKRYPVQPARRMTFEYVMIDGVNDSSQDALNLAKLLSGMRCKVNLIPLNPFPGSTMKRSPDKRILAFQNILMQEKVRALVRASRGQDIQAACGQLRAGNSI